MVVLASCLFLSRLCEPGNVRNELGDEVDLCICDGRCRNLGDLMNAKGMAARGEIEDMGLHGLGRVLRYIATHRLVVSGMVCDAISFAGLLALLATTNLAFAVPVTALSNISDGTGAMVLEGACQLAPLGGGYPCRNWNCLDIHSLVTNLPIVLETKVMPFPPC